MKLSIQAGKTSESINIFIRDSSSTTGAGLTGLVFNTASLTAYYSFSGANATATAITLVTLVAVNSAYSSGGFKEIDATNMPGWYRFDIPNAALATAKGRSVALHFKGATNMAPTPVEIELTGWDNQDSVHGGMSALPNTACTNNASLLTSGTGTDQISVSAGKVSANATQWGGVNVTGMPMPTYTQPTGFLAATFPATIASTTNITGGTITTVTNLTNAPTAGDLTATMKTSIQTELTTYGALKPTVTGRTLDVASTGGVTLTDGSLTTAKLGTFVLAKTTNITGFNDIAATAIVSGGAIVTSGGLANSNMMAVFNDTDTPPNLVTWITYLNDNGNLPADVISWRGSQPSILSSGNIPANTKQINSTSVQGTGISSDLWRG